MARNPSAALVLTAALTGVAARALAAGGPAGNPYDLGKTEDGKLIIAPGIFGPFLPGSTCYAGSAGCTPATPSDAIDQASGPLNDIGDMQKNASANGGAVPGDSPSTKPEGQDVNLPNGDHAVLYSDGNVAYKGQVQRCDAVPACKEYQDSKNPSRKQKVDGGMKALADTTPPPPQKADASDETSPEDTGGSLAQAMGAGRNTTPPAPTAVADRKSSDDANKQVAASVESGDPRSLASHLTYVKLQQFARGEKRDAQGRSAVRALHDTVSAGADKNADIDDDGSSPAPFRATVNQ